jgi:hypothetical protein
MNRLRIEGLGLSTSVDRSSTKSENAERDRDKLLFSKT